MIDIHQLSSLNLQGVTISAQIDADGTLFPVEGAFSKLLGAAKEHALPRIHTVVVHPNQKDVPPELSDPYSELRVLKAWTLEEAVQRILVDEQTRWGDIPDFREVLYRHREFVGREWLMQQVDVAIEQAVTGQGPAHILITGRPGTGKSAFVAHRISGQTGAVCHFIRRGEGDLDHPTILLKSLTAQLRRIYALPMRAEERNLPAADVFQRVLKQLSRKLQNGQHQVIWIDGLDEAFGPTGRFSDRSLSDILPLNGLPRGIILVLTSRPGGEHLTWLEDPQQFRSISIDAQLKNSEEDIRAYLIRQNEALGLGLMPDFLNKLVEASEGCFVAAVRYLHPNPYLKEVLAEWQSHPERIPKGLNGWLNWQWQWLLRAAREQNIPERIVIGVLGYLAIADEKERAKVLIHFLSEDQLEAYWDRVLRLSSELVEPVQTGSGSDVRYRFFHPHFAEFIWEKIKQSIESTLEVPKDYVLEGYPIQKDSVKSRPKPFITRLSVGVGITLLLTGIFVLLAWLYRPTWSFLPPLFSPAATAPPRATSLSTAPPTITSLLTATPTKVRTITSALQTPIVSESPVLSNLPFITPSLTVTQVFDSSATVISSTNISQLIEQARLGKGRAGEVSFSPDGRLLAVASGVGIWLYDSQTGDPLRLLEGHTRSVNSIAWSPGGDKLASGGNDATVRVWDPVEGQELLQLVGHTEPVNSVAWSPDGKQLASGSNDRTIRLWDIANSQEVDQLTGHTDIVFSVAWSPDGRQLASGSGDQTIRLWDAGTGQELSQLTGHKEPVESVAWSPDGKRLASGSDESIIRIWDGGSGQELLQITGFVSWISSIAWSPDGKRLASGGGDSIIRLWDADNGLELLQQDGHHDWIRSVSWSSDGQRLASSSNDGTVRIWEIASGRELRIEGHLSIVEDIAWSPDGQQLAFCGWNKAVLVWDTISPGKTMILKGDIDWIRSVAWSPDGRKLASGDHSGDLRVWNMPGGDKMLELKEHPGFINSIAWSSDSSLLASVSDDGIDNNDDDDDGFLRVRDITTGELILERDMSPESANVLAWSPNGTQIALGGSSGIVHVFDVSKGEEILQLIGHTDVIFSLAWSPDGSKLASGSGEGDIRVWDIVSGQELLLLRGHTGIVRALAWSPDGTLLASGGDDETIRIWDGSNGWQLFRLEKHLDRISSVAWSSDGSRLASASADGTIRIWRLP